MQNDRFLYRFIKEKSNYLKGTLANMSIFFEIADLSFELVGISINLVTPDILHFFHNTPSINHRVITCYTDFVSNYAPINGSILCQDPYCVVLSETQYESRIFFMNPYADIYGIYHEISDDVFRIETKRSIIDMFFIELLCIEKYLLQQDAFILHSCFINYKNNGITFTAPSGTGKSTQGALWTEHLKAQVINGDRSIIQKKDNRWLIHSLPFCGSSSLNHNSSLILKKIAIVNRSQIDHVEDAFIDYKLHYKNKELMALIASDSTIIQKIEINEGVENFVTIMKEITYNKWNADSVDHVFKLVEELFTDHMIVNLFCTPTANACYVLKEYLEYD